MVLKYLIQNTTGLSGLSYFMYFCWTLNILKVFLIAFALIISRGNNGGNTKKNWLGKFQS